MNTRPERPDEAAAEPPPDALAQAMADQLERWALALGAPPALARPVARLGHAVLRAEREGHVCVPLAEAWPDGAPPPLATLLASGVVGTPAAPGARPLIVDDEGRVYLHRSFDFERRLARRLVRSARAAPAAPGPALRRQLAALFAGGWQPGDHRVDWQQLATALALRQRFAVISGGPGTGKTTTVVNLLACLLEAEPGCRIALAAPTGKAAARLAEAIGERAAHLPPALRERLPASASTVHRLLGVTPAGFVHHAGRPLPIDALVVDEASMLDLALATQLMEAVPPAARIVLLGDQHQLAAVESGAVFAELGADPTLGADCRADLEAACGLAPGRLQPPAPLHAGALPDSAIWFERNFRFAADSAIGRLAVQVRQGRGAEALATLREAGADGDALRWWDDAAEAPAAAVRRHLLQAHAGYLDAVRRDPHDAPALAAALARFRVLCAQREGPRGMLALNAWLDNHAREQLAPLLQRHPAAPGSAGYVGRPVMVLRNQPLLQLFNGDIGITLPAPEGGLAVAFVQADGQVRRVPAWRLPEHQSAWAMTVHKSQGSEFDEVLVLLPARRSPVLTRELLYTAVTRARQRVGLAGSAAVVAAAIAAPTRRHSGLIARLREALAESPNPAPPA